jgi:hypothetical protein
VPKVLDVRTRNSRLAARSVPSNFQLMSRPLAILDIECYSTLGRVKKWTFLLWNVGVGKGERQPRRLTGKPRRCLDPALGYEEGRKQGTVYVEIARAPPSEGEESAGDQSLTLPGNKLIIQSLFVSLCRAFSVIYISLSLYHLWYAVPPLGFLLHYLRITVHACSDSSLSVCPAFCRPLPTPRKHIRGEEVQLHTFLTSALDGGEWSALPHGRFTTQGGGPLPTDWINKGWVGPRPGLDDFERRKTFCSYWDSNPRILWRLA